MGTAFTNSLVLRKCTPFSRSTQASNLVAEAEQTSKKLVIFCGDLSSELVVLSAYLLKLVECLLEEEFESLVLLAFYTRRVALYTRSVASGGVRRRSKILSAIRAAPEGAAPHDDRAKLKLKEGADRSLPRN